MQRYNGQLLNQFPNTVTGISAAGAQITVRVKSTGALATLYAANSTSGSTLSNPLTADSKGYYGFYAPDGVYTLDVSLSGTPQLEIQLQDVASLQSQFNNAVLNAGYIPVGTFAAGCTISQANGVVSDSSSYWRWDGALPKAVTAGSSPTPVGVGGWVLVGGTAGITEFESNLAVNGSTKIISGIAAKDYARKYRDMPSVKDFGAVGDGVTNDTTSIKAAIASLATTGGTLYFPAGVYKVTETLYIPSGVTLQGAGSFQATAPIRYGASTIFCSHTGAAMISLKGSNGCGLRDIALVGDQLAKPKTGLCLGRSTSASAGHHQIDNISITGWFTVAAIYSIASEENEMRKVFTWNFGGDAPYGLVSSTQDIFNVDSLVTSTNIHNTYSNVVMYVTSALSTSAGIFLQTSNDMGNIAFNNCYIIPFAGAYVRISNGALDGTAAFGPISFNGTSGEIFSGGAPKLGYYIAASTPVTLAGLSILNSRFQLPANAGGDVYDILIEDNVTLTNPNIVIQPPEAFPYATSKVRPDKTKGGVVSVGRRFNWIDIPLTGGWANSFGAPYAAASYRVEIDGTVSFRGVVSAGTGVIFTLPTELRPANRQIYTSSSSSGLVRLLVEVNGEVSLQSGSNSEVNLSPISFRAGL